MAATQNSYTGNGSTTNYSFTFPYLKTADVKCSIDATETTAFTLANATTVQFNSAPANGAKIKIFRETDDSDLTATFYAGSAIKSSDLNDNFTQNLYTTQEVNARYLSNLGGTMLGDLAMGEDADIIFEGATDNTNETKLTVADPTADRTITFPDVTGTVVTTGDSGTVATGMIAADAITSAKIADDQINSEHYVDGSIDTAHIADSQVTTAKIANSNVTTDKIANDAVTSAKIADDQINSEHYVDGSIDTAHIADSQITSAKIADGTIVAGDLATDAVTTVKITDANVTTAKIANDAITGAKIADDEINSEHYVAGSIDTEHIANNQVTTSKIADLNVTTGKIAADAITGAKIADDQINSEHYAAGSIDTEHIADSQISTAKIADDAVTTAKIFDTELKYLAGMQLATASKLADSTALTSDIADLNQIDGLTKQTTISDSDASFPTSGAVVDYVAAQIAPLGGLEVIATEVAFPNTQPSAGVVISISDAGGVVFNGSGTSTTGRTVGGSTVTINNAPSSLNSETLVAGVGLMVSSTGSGQIYNYHKILGKEEDIKQLSDDINDFNARYRVGSSNPTSALDAGDLFFNTSTSKLLVYNATNSAWEEAQSIGNFFISTFSESFDGSRTAFTISNAPANAQQLIISINGVIQKPNSGTGQPSEGFTLSGSTVTFSAAIPSGSNYFAVVLGSTVNIGTPSDNTVTTAILQNGSVTNDKVNASAAIQGTKISPDFGSQNITTTGRVLLGTTTEGFADGDDLTIATSGNTGMTIRSGTTSYSSIFFSDATSGGGEYDGFIQYNHDTQKLTIGTGATGSSDLAIDSSGNLSLGTTTTNTSDKLTIVDTGDTFASIRSDTEADDRYQVLDFAYGTGNRSSSNMTASIGAKTHSQSGGTLKADLAFSTNGGDSVTQKMIIKDDGKVGINSSSPESKLTVHSTDRHVQQLIAENGVTANTTSGTIYRQQYTTAGTSRRMGFFGIKRKGGSGDQTANFVMELCPDNSTSLGLASPASYTTAFTFTNTGMMEVKSGGGVRFHNYGDGTGIDSNLLDDYEEGTFTPEIKGTDGSTPTSYYHQEGGYTKIGRLVTCIMRIRINDGTGLNGDLMLDNLPFNVLRVNSSTGLSGFGHPAYFASANSNLTTIVCTPVGGGDTAYFYGQASASNGMGSLSTTYINSNFDIRLYLTYYAS